MIIIVLTEQYKSIKVHQESEIVFEELQHQISLNNKLTRDVESLSAQIQRVVSPSQIAFNQSDPVEVKKLLQLEIRLKKRSADLTSYDKITYET